MDRRCASTTNAEHAGSCAPGRRARPAVAGAGRVGAEVGAGVQVDVRGAGEEARGRRDRVVGGVEHDGREVEEHAVEQGGRGRRPRPSSSHSEVTPFSRSVSAASLAAFASPTAEVGPDVPVAGAGRAARGGAGRRAGRGVPSGVTPMPSSVRAGQLRPRPARRGRPRRSRRALRSTAAAAASHVGAVVPVLGRGQRERALLGLQLGGLVQAALDVGHGAQDRPVRPTGSGARPCGIPLTHPDAPGSCCSAHRLPSGSAKPTNRPQARSSTPSASMPRSRRSA